MIELDEIYEEARELYRRLSDFRIALTQKEGTTDKETAIADYIFRAVDRERLVLRELGKALQISKQEGNDLHNLIERL